MKERFREVLLNRKVYKFGDCIPVSDIVYKRLKKKGYNPKIVVGWVEVSDIDGVLEPDYEFNKLFYGKTMKRDIKNGNDYPRTLPHTWVECNKHRIDITKNQFNIYGEIEGYFPYWIELESYKDKKGRVIYKIIKYKKKEVNNGRNFGEKR